MTIEAILILHVRMIDELCRLSIWRLLFQGRLVLLVGYLKKRLVGCSTLVKRTSGALPQPRGAATHDVDHLNVNALFLTYVQMNHDEICSLTTRFLISYDSTNYYSHHTFIAKTRGCVSLWLQDRHLTIVWTPSPLHMCL